MADYKNVYPQFKALGVEVVAVSVDPPDRSAAMRADLGLEFPLLSDSSREVITEWRLLNSLEKGGIAYPATFLIEPGRKVLFASTEDMGWRIPAAAMLRYVRQVAAGEHAEVPSRGMVSPVTTFARAMMNALFHGVRVAR